MQIFGTNSIQNHSAVQNASIQKTHGVESSTSVDSANASGTVGVDTVDQLDISPEAQMLSDLSGASEIRADRVAELRSQIQSGVYETPEKLDAAVSRMINEYA